MSKGAKVNTIIDGTKEPVRGDWAGDLGLGVKSTPTRNLDEVENDTLLTRAEAEKWGQGVSHTGEVTLVEPVDVHARARLLKTVDVAHGKLDAELGKAMREGLGKLLEEKQAELERVKAERDLLQGNELLLVESKRSAMADRDDEYGARRVAERERDEAQRDLEAERREHARTRELLEQARQIGPLA